MIELKGVTSRHRRASVVAEIRDLLTTKGQTLAEAIHERGLYFRISVIGSCNISCTFCHNEGAPTTGKIKLSTVDRAIAAAVQVGFRRVQFTGGEPLLRSDIGDFVRLARGYVANVGVTTNGTYLPVRLDSLLDAGLTRMHVSLQTKSLIEAGSVEKWGIPPWLAPTVERAKGGAFTLRVNLPVPAHMLPQAEDFLHLAIGSGVDVKVFSVLPEGIFRSDEYPISELENMVERVNTIQAGAKASVLLRGFRPPQGIRCPNCKDLLRCKEQSHSLRLGSDLILRPCLATRDWDMQLKLDSIDQCITEATLLALDYLWGHIETT